MFELIYLNQPIGANILKYMNINYTYGLPWYVCIVRLHTLGVHELFNIVALSIEDKDNDRDNILEVIFDKSFWIWHFFSTY